MKFTAKQRIAAHAVKKFHIYVQILKDHLRCTYTHVQLAVSGMSYQPPIPFTSVPFNMYISILCVGIFTLIAYLSWAFGWVTYNKVAGKKACCGDEKPTVASREFIAPVGIPLATGATQGTSNLVDPVSIDYHIGTQPDKVISPSPSAYVETLPPTVILEDLQKAYDAFWVGDLQRDNYPAKPKKPRKPRVVKPDLILGAEPEQPKRRRGGSRGTGTK